jgi:hypothetical protein
MEVDVRTLVWAGAVAIIVTGSGAVAGQNPSRPAPAGMVTVLAERARIRLAVNPTAVLDRMLSFDATADNRISRDELPERMQGLMARGDRNQDGFLTPDEIVPLSDIRRSAPRRPFTGTARRAPSLADIIGDLKLPAETHDRALAIVNGPRSVDDTGNVDFTTEIRDLLNDEDYENYVAAAARLRNTPRIIGGSVGGVVRGRASPSPVATKDGRRVEVSTPMAP